MRLVPVLVTCTLVLSMAVWTRSQSTGRVSFHEESSEERARDHADSENEQRLYNGTRQGKNLFDWIGLGIGRNADPYMAKTNKECLAGDLAECFKSQALEYFSGFFDHDTYNLNENLRVVRMPGEVVKEVNRQPYEFSSQPRSDESEWDQLMKFGLRKLEKFVKTATIELSIPVEETGRNSVYAPRFLDEIADEIDTLENKKDTLFSRHQLKKLLIPMLIVLKLFKIKLLLFLPLILGLASFKKFLGFLAIVIPGLIGFFKLYKPLSQNYHPPVYSQSGIGYPYYTDYHNGHRDTVSFGQDLAYQGYREYQS